MLFGFMEMLYGSLYVRLYPLRTLYTRETRRLAQGRRMTNMRAFSALRARGV
jgi:hypothetical protein